MLGIGLGILAVAVIVGFVTGYIPLPDTAPVTGAVVGDGTTVVGAPSSNGFATSVSTSGYDPIGASATNVNAELWEVRSDGSMSNVVGETNANAGVTSLATTLPNTFNGFIMIGNDDATSGTDRGTEYYYSKNSVSWANREGLIVFDRLPTYAEGTLTESGYDDGTLESTLNVTVGSGSRVTTTELRIEVSADAVFGNPEVSRPIAVCFNETTAGMFSEIKPKSFDSTIPVPEHLSSFSYLSPCYVLPISALQEGVAGEQSSYRFGIDIEANAGQNPGVTDNSHALFLDATYYQNDAGEWVTGFEDKSSTTADADIGSANSNDNFQIIWFN